MMLPRWTVYPALVVLSTVFVAAIPERSGDDPYEGAAVGSASGSSAAVRSYEHKPLVILGIDGMDPDILEDVIAKYPEDMQNFAALARERDGIQSLGTSIPPQSPVAWSNFITGLNPGGHGVFDFIHRDLVTRGPKSSAADTEPGIHLFNLGQYKVEIPGESIPTRTGEAFWTRLERHGIPADIWRMPANFPVEPSRGVSFPGMMTPAMDSAYGECSLISTDNDLITALDYEKAQLVIEYEEGRLDFGIKGPPNTQKVGDPVVTAPVVVSLDREANAILMDVGSERLVMQPGQWSDFVTLDFPMLPLGMSTQTGMVRFYLRSISPEFVLYVSPVNFDPLAPAVPVSEPVDASAALAAAIGRYYTQGMAEDVNALKDEVLTDAEFMQQVELIYKQRRNMLGYALDNYLEEGEGGLLFFYFSTVDLACHMMWRHFESHPAGDPEIANQDSSHWSGRPGSTWKDTVHDLYRKMDPVLGEIRQRLGEDVPIVVMSDHGFAPYKRKFDLNRWLMDNGYLVLKSGRKPEVDPKPSKAEQVWIFDAVDWTKTRAYGMGFNGLYLNLAGREADNPETKDVDEGGIVQPGAEAESLLAELKRKLEAVVDPETGQRPVLRCDVASECYSGPRVHEAPDIQVGYAAGYGNSDGASQGRITCAVLQDNTGGTFNGSHLMAPEAVPGILLTNQDLASGAHRLQDLTVEIFKYYGVKPPAELEGHAVFQ